MRGTLGTARIERYLQDGVAVDEIPFLPPGYRLHSSEDRSIIGDAPKNFVSYPSATPDGHAYIAKAPRREGPRECVTEYMIYCVGGPLGVNLARARLARLPVARGAKQDVRFLSRYFLAPGEQLLHGVELAAECLEISPVTLSQEVTREREWRFYTVGIIDEMLKQVAREPDELRELRRGFARMMAFDALVGANDRHPQNWGLIINALDKSKPIRFAPLFDTARGLFWNISEERLRQKESSGLRKEFIVNYARKSTPLIGLESDVRPNHFDVIRAMLEMDGGCGFERHIRAVVSRFSASETERMLHAKFRRLISRRRLCFVRDLLLYRHSELKSILGLM